MQFYNLVKPSTIPHSANLRQIESLSASYDERAIIELISEKRILSHPRKRTYIIETLDLIVRFTYLSEELDYGSLDGRLERDAPRYFQFGRDNEDRFPTDFTEVDSVKTHLFSLPPVTNIASYQRIHDLTLSDVIIPSLIPRLSVARVEAFEYKETTYNSITVVDTTQYKGQHRIFDPLTLNAQDYLNALDDNEVDLFCNLQLVKTVVNGNYAYACNVGKFAFDGIEYAGARIIIEANHDNLVLKKQELIDLYSIPSDRQGPFISAYEELYELAEAYSELNFTKVKEIIDSEKSRNPSRLTVFGADISISILAKSVFPILIIMCLYINLHLQEAMRRVGTSPSSEIDVPWIGIYSGANSRYAVFVQLIVFPLALMVLIYFKSQQISELIMASIFCLVLLSINCFNYLIVGKLRSTLYSDSGRVIIIGEC